MSGHSKWSTIKRKKEKSDAARGRLFTKLIKEITVAARQGGGDENSNPRLRTAIQSAKTNNMPQANIDKAIKKGTGDLPGIVYEEIVYEGFGPGGIALLIEIVTDNKNRTVADVRNILGKYGGSMGAVGSVSWIFDKKGIIVVEDSKVTEDELIEVTIEQGAEDIINDGGVFEIVTLQEEFENVKKALKSANIDFSSSNLTMVPNNFKRLEGEEAGQVLKLMDALEEHDDVQNVYSNFDIDDEEMKNF